MAPVVFSLVVFIFLLTALALFARGGPTETVHREIGSKPPNENLARHAPQTLRTLGLVVQAVQQAITSRHTTAANAAPGSTVRVAV